MEKNSGYMAGTVNRRRAIVIAGTLIVAGSLSACVSPRIVYPKNVPEYEMGTPIKFTSPQGFTFYTNEVIVHSAVITDAEEENRSKTGKTLTLDVQWKMKQGEAYISSYSVGVRDMQPMEMESYYPNDETFPPKRLHAGDEMRGIIRTDAPEGPFYVGFRDIKGQTRGIIRLESSKLYSKSGI